MATYTVTGRPLNYSDYGDQAELIRATMQLVPIGASITLTLPGPIDTKVKGHGALK